MVSQQKSSPRIAFFVTCLVDLFRPSIGFAALKLLTEAGCEVVVPSQQSCCGQPAYNAGDRARAQQIARQVINQFEAYDAVVLPSGSCAGMMVKHYPELLGDDPEWAERAQQFASRCYELSVFLVEQMNYHPQSLFCRQKATYHDSCAGLRELGIKNQPRNLLSQVAGLEILPLPEPDSCCGFGGTFCLKYAEVSTAITDAKIANIEASGADLLLAGDLGCLLAMAGRMARLGKTIEVRHYAEILAGSDRSHPSIGRELAEGQ
ncbi:MAG: (Fe-S)-binding protein [Candidatus Pacebacteria bacterium]|nr:(Fe-S)-binding protein [Candidatus Paceibacterota bacterium]